MHVIEKHARLYTCIVTCTCICTCINACITSYFQILIHQLLIVDDQTLLLMDYEEVH